MSFNPKTKASTLSGPKTIESQLQKQNLSSVLIKLDHLFDLLPLGSSVSNLVNLSLKHIVIKKQNPDDFLLSCYVSHLQHKTTKSCLYYSIPVLGNVLKVKDLIQSPKDSLAECIEKDITEQTQRYQEDNMNLEFEKKITI